MMNTIKILVMIITVISTAGDIPVNIRKERQEMATKTASDKKQILAHIDSIFTAFVKRDRETIRRLHTSDWTGFQGPSKAIERGIESYMKNADASLDHFNGTGYEILDSEVHIYGDMALVYYIARYDYRGNDGNNGSIPLRSIDVYRCENGVWNQSGSHIAVIPDGGDWGEERIEASSDHGDTLNSTAATAAFQSESSMLRTLAPSEREELLKAREAVWRAWFAGDHVALHATVPVEAIAMDPGVADWANQNEILRRSSTFAASGRLLNLEFPKTRMQVYGNVAILYTSFVFETQQDGQRNVTSGRGTEVFVNRDGKWLNTGWHLEPQETDVNP